MKNVDFFIKKSNDPYGLFKDKDFVDILRRMISYQHYIRPNVSEIMRCKFVVEQMDGVLVK